MVVAERRALSNAPYLAAHGQGCGMRDALPYVAARGQASPPSIRRSRDRWRLHVLFRLVSHRPVVRLTLYPVLYGLAPPDQGTRLAFHKCLRHRFLVGVFFP
jgi:hypothetical protein